MTTTDIKSAPTDPTPEPLAEWCEFSGNYHHESDEDGYDFGPAREHVLEFDHVVASTDQPSPGGSQPSALVCVTVQEKSYYDHCEDDDPTVALAATSYPHFTPAEARELAATLIAAADRADEIAEQRARTSVAA